MSSDKEMREVFEAKWPSIDAQWWPVDPKEFAFLIWQAALNSRKQMGEDEAMDIIASHLDGRIRPAGLRAGVRALLTVQGENR